MTAPRPGNESIIASASHLAFSFETHCVFRSLDVEICRGESFAVLGPGGSGKSTLLKLLAGLLLPSAGTASFLGGAWNALGNAETIQLRRRLSMTFQQSGLFDSMTAFENLDFPLREMSQMDPMQRRARIAESLDEVGLSGCEALRVHEMSGGMQKRLGIARALLQKPELVLYDDPTAGLDPITSRAIVELIVGMKRRHGMTLIFVTSDPTQALRVADRVGFLWDGRFVEVSVPDEMRKSNSPAVRQFLEGRLEGPLTIGGGR